MHDNRKALVSMNLYPLLRAHIYHILRIHGQNQIGAQFYNRVA
jgi:hypothetical protein